MINEHLTTQKEELAQLEEELLLRERVERRVVRELHRERRLALRERAQRVGVPDEPLERHRRVNAALADELAGPIHALSIVAKTPEQWARSAAVAASPECLGGSRR